MSDSSSQPSAPQLQRSFRGHRGAVTSVAIIPAPAPLTTNRGQALSPRGDSKPSQHSLIASGSADGTVMLWSTNPTVRALRFAGHRGPVNDVCFYHTHSHYNPSGMATSAAAAAGNLIASCSSDSTIRLWIPSVKGDSSVIKAHSASVRGVCFSSSAAGNSPSPMLLSYSDDKSCKLWSVLTTKFITSFLGHTNWVRAAAMSHGGSSAVHFEDSGSSGGMLCASGGDDKVVYVWDPRACSRGSGVSTAASKPGVPSQSAYASSAITHSLYYQHSPITALAFSPTNSNVLASGAADGTVQVYDLRMSGEKTGSAGRSQAGALLQHYGPGGGSGAANTNYHADAVTSLDFDPVVGSMLLSSSNDGTVKMWDLSEGFLYCTLTAHEGPALKARFSPQFSLPRSSEYPVCQFATAGRDGLVLSWESTLPIRKAAVEESAAAANATRGIEEPAMTKLVSPVAPAPTTPSFVRPTTSSSLRKARTDQQFAAQREESRPQTSSGVRASSARAASGARPQSAAPRAPLNELTNRANSDTAKGGKKQLNNLHYDESYELEAVEGKGAATPQLPPAPTEGTQVEVLSKMVESLQDQLTQLRTSSAEESRQLRHTIENQEAMNRQLLAQFEQALGFLVAQHGGVPAELSIGSTPAQPAAR